MQPDGSAVVIADGATFGAFVGAVTAYARAQGNTMLYFPECFEWLILRSGVLEIENIAEILSHPEDYIESAKFFSWERYFANLLSRETENDPVRAYRKASLSTFYTEGKNKEMILQVMPEELREILK